MPAAIDETVRSLHVTKTIDINANIDIAYESLLAELGPEGTMPDGKAFPMTFEPWPGGRWFRDLGDNAGHLWGHVQVIKPPALIEICGPLFMSYPAISHVQYRLTADGPRTRLALTHRAMGQMPEEHMSGVHEGWNHSLERIRQIAESRRR